MHLHKEEYRHAFSKVGLVILLFLQGALFFGVERLLLDCETWFCKITSERGPSSRQISLGTIIEIWNFGLEHGQFDSESFTVHVVGCMELVNLNLWHVFIKV